MEAIANTTVISNFAAAGRLDILRALLGQVYISTDVYAEIQDGLAEGASFYAGIETQIYPLTIEAGYRSPYGHLADLVNIGDPAPPTPAA